MLRLIQLKHCHVLHNIRLSYSVSMYSCPYLNLLGSFSNYLQPLTCLHHHSANIIFSLNMTKPSQFLSLYSLTIPTLSLPSRCLDSALDLNTVLQLDFSHSTHLSHHHHHCSL